MSSLSLTVKTSGFIYERCLAISFYKSSCTSASAISSKVYSYVSSLNLPLDWLLARFSRSLLLVFLFLFSYLITLCKYCIYDFLLVISLSLSLSLSLSILGVGDLFLKLCLEEIEFVDYFLNFIPSRTICELYRNGA